jgi:hypothetical protein
MNVMAAFDFKKDRKDLYQPTTNPSIADVPGMLYIMMDGKGDPNTSEAYREAMQVLYGLAWTIRMNKSEKDYFEYVVAPLEGLWDFAGHSPIFADGAGFDKSSLIWTSMIRQPDFVTPDVFNNAKAKLQKKKPELDVTRARLETYAEGLCVQAMHIGPYDTEPATIKAMERYREQRGFAADYTHGRRHHEIYLSNPQQCAPERMKTVLRLPIKRRR